MTTINDAIAKLKALGAGGENDAMAFGQAFGECPDEFARLDELAGGALQRIVDSYNEGLEAEPQDKAAFARVRHLVATCPTEPEGDERWRR